MKHTLKWMVVPYNATNQCSPSKVEHDLSNVLQKNTDPYTKISEYNHTLAKYQEPLHPIVPSAKSFQSSEIVTPISSQIKSSFKNNLKSNIKKQLKFDQNYNPSPIETTPSQSPIKTSSSRSPKTSPDLSSNTISKIEDRTLYDTPKGLDPFENSFKFFDSPIKNKEFRPNKILSKVENKKQIKKQDKTLKEQSPKGVKPKTRSDTVRERNLKAKESRQENIDKNRQHIDDEEDQIKLTSNWINFK